MIPESRTTQMRVYIDCDRKGESFVIRCVENEFEAAPFLTIGTLPVKTVVVDFAYNRE